MPRHRIGSLLLQGFCPVLVAPFAGVCGVDPDYRDAAVGGHAGKAVAEFSGRDARHDASQPFPTLAAAESFTPDGARVGEIEILHDDRSTAGVCGLIKQGCYRRTHAAIPVTGAQAVGLNRDRARVADRIARRVQHTAGQMVGVQIQTQHPPSPELAKDPAQIRMWLSMRHPDTSDPERRRT
jgi:hypothetical protein